MKKIKDCFNDLLVNVVMKLLKGMSPVIKEAIDNPENLKFEGRIEGSKLVVEITVKDEP